MQLQSDIKMTGKLSIKKFNEFNELIEERNIDNLVVTAGKSHIAQRLYTDSETKMSHMAVGSSTTISALSQTGLLSELGRVALSSTIVSGANVTYTAVFGVGVATGSITEAAILNDSSSGTMLCRTTFPVIVKTGSDTIAISWTVSVG